MPRFCSNCGYQVEADSVFCDTCGFDLTSRNDFNHNLKSSHPDKTVIRSKFPLNYDYYRRSPPKFTKNLTLGIILSVILFLTGVLVIPLLMNQDSYHHNSNTTQPEIIGEKIYQIDEDSALSNIFLNITIPHGSVHIYITQSEILFGSYIEIIGFPHQSVEDASNFFETREENASYLYLTSDDSFEYNVWITISSLTIISIITVLEEGDIYLDAYQAILSSLFTHSSQGEIFISIADSLIISSDYFSKFHCYIGNGNLIVFHYNLVYESNDFYWELGSDSGVIDLYLLQEALIPASFINYDVYSSQGDILFNSYIQKEIGVNITAIASDLIFIDHSYFGFFDSIELPFTFVSENYQSSLTRMSFMLLCRNGNIDCLEIDYYP